MESSQKVASTNIIAKQILFNEVKEKDFDLKKLGLNNLSLTLARWLFPKTLYKDEEIEKTSSRFSGKTFEEAFPYRSDWGLEVENNFVKLYMQPDDFYKCENFDPYKLIPSKIDYVTKVARFCHVLGYNVSAMYSENDIGKVIGYVVSTDIMQKQIPIKSFGEVREFGVDKTVKKRHLADDTLNLAYHYMYNYPEDYTKQDYEEVISLLKKIGEQRMAKNLELVEKIYNFDAEKEGTPFNLYKIQSEYLAGQFCGDSLSDDRFEYEWYIEKPTNIDCYRLFTAPKLVMQYTDKENGVCSGSVIDMDEVMRMDKASEFESWVNTCIFYDPYIQSEIDKEER